MQQPIPRKISLVRQTAEVLRQRIGSGEWQDCLPPERQLCRMLQVARNTLRAALAELQDGGVVGIGHRGRSRRPVAVRRQRSPSPGDVVVFLTPERIEALQPATLVQVDLLRERLGDAGLRLLLESPAACRMKHPGGPLERLLHLHPDAVWILHRSARPVQDWFRSCGLRALILGYPHEGVNLPFVTEDMAAAAVHAAGRLLARGHRIVGLLRPARELAGHRVVRDALSGAFARAAGSETALVDIRHTGTREGLVNALDRILGLPDSPTAFLTVASADLVTLLTHLGRSGIRVPRDVSMVHLFDDPILDSIVPTIAHYRVSPAVMIKRMADLVLRIRLEGTPAARSSCVMTDFVPGDSLGPAAPPPMVQKRNQ